MAAAVFVAAGTACGYGSSDWVVSVVKLIFCPECQDVKALHRYKMTVCDCTKSSGWYIDDLNAQVNQHAIILGINNSSFGTALRMHKANRKLNNRFESFFIPITADSIEVIDDLDGRSH